MEKKPQTKLSDLPNFKRDERAKSFFSYTDLSDGKKRYGFRREFKGRNLNKRGFHTKAEAEAELAKMMSAEPSETVKLEPTRLQDALDAYRRHLELRGQAKNKSRAYMFGIVSLCNVLQTFVDNYKNKLVRAVSHDDLVEWYLWLQNVRRVSQASAASHLGRLNGMLKIVEGRADLANTWSRPKYSEKPKTENGGRMVTPAEYKALRESLLNPQPCKRIAERRALWRDAADAVLLGRNTGARLNEILRARLVSIDLNAKTIKLEGSKTEKQREVPLSAAACEIIKARIRDGVTSEVHLFARASTAYFDNAVEQACVDAAKVAGIKFGRKTPGGFTFHSLRHTYITELLSLGVDAGTVMKYSGHKSYETFSVYLHETVWGKHKALQIIDAIDAPENGGIVAGSESETGVLGGNEGNTLIAVNS